MKLLRRARVRPRQLAVLGSGLAAVLLGAPGLARAEWGNASWGEFVWGQAAPAVPALGRVGTLLVVVAVLALGMRFAHPSGRRRGAHSRPAPR